MMITGQLRASDPREDKQAQLADGSGIAARIFYGLASLTMQVDSVGCVTLVYRDGRTDENKNFFVGFMDEIALLDKESLATTTGGVLAVE